MRSCRTFYTRRFPRRLLTAAVRAGLWPGPVTRPRGTYPHLRHSFSLHTVVAILGRDDLGRHPGVVAIAFHQADRTLGRGHAALRILRARILGILGDPNAKLGREVFQLFGRIVAHELTRAVRGAALDVLGDVALDLVPLQMLGQ